MTGKHGFFKSKLVKIVVLAGKHCRTQVIIQCRAPVFSGICNISIGKPFGKIKQCLVGGKFAEIISKQNIVHQYSGNSLSYLAAKIIMIAIKINEHFIIHQFGKPPVFCQSIPSPILDCCISSKLL